MEKPVRGILFDLWNTLMASTASVNPVVDLGRRLERAGAQRWLRALERGMMRRRLASIEEALPEIEREAGVSLTETQRSEAARAWREGCRLSFVFPEVLPVLERLRRTYRIGILSNTQSFDMETVGESGLLERADVVRFSCDTGWLKPDARAYSDALEALGTSPHETLMVGDRYRDDVDGARRAGLRAVMIRRRGAALSWAEADSESVTRESRLRSALSAETHRIKEPHNEPFITDLRDVERMIETNPAPRSSSPLGPTETTPA